MSETPEAAIHSQVQYSSTQPDKVELNAYGVPISKNAGKIGSRIGKLVRSHVPISYESWGKVPKKYKDDVWMELIINIFRIGLTCKRLFFEEKMAESFRRHKSKLRINYYDKFNNDEDRLKICPRGISQVDWEGFLKNEVKPSSSERRNLGRKNRAMYNYGHHTGRTSHAVIEHEMVIANPTKEITRRHVWEKAHTKKDGTISDAVSPYFDKIAKAKETITDSDECDLPLSEDIITQVFGKDNRGRTRSVGSKVSRTQVNACAIPCKQLKRNHGDSEEIKVRMTNMEGHLMALYDMFNGYINQGRCVPDMTSNVGRNNNEGVEKNHTNDVVVQPNSSNTINQKCEILNVDLEVIAKGYICQNSTTSVVHGNSMPSTHEKIVVDSILLPEEKTAKQNHPFAMTFGELGIGAYVCHPKRLIRYL